MTAPRIGQVLFIALCYLLIVVSLRFLFIGAERAFPATAYQMQLKPLTMTAHVLASSVAMACLPLQFLRPLRSARPRLHRWIGSACVAGIVIGGITGVSLGLSSRYGTLGVVGFVTGATLWTAAAVVATSLALVGRTAAHRTWMIIVAALSFGAVSIRLEMPLFLVAFNVTGDFNVELTAWTCWALNLAILALWHGRALAARQVRFA